MLMMTIKEGDYLMIGDHICVQFIKELSGKRMRIGIDAPKSVDIARGKPYESALLENEQENAEKLNEIEAQKQLAAKARQKVALKEQARKVKQAEKRANGYTSDDAL